MTNEKKLDPKILKMAYQKRLGEMNSEISDLKKTYPDLMSPDDIMKLQDQLNTKRSEFDVKQKELGETEQDMKELNRKIEAKLTMTQDPNKEIDRLISSASLKKQEMENIKNEILELNKQLELALNEMTMKYARLISNRNKIIEKIKEIENQDARNELPPTAEIKAVEQKSTPFGTVALPKNLFENISNAADWQQAFAAKYKLLINSVNAESTLILSSSNQNIQLQVTKEKITGSWSKEDEQLAIAMMVELYMKGIENQKIDHHIVEAKSVDITQQIERQLAKQLTAAGIMQCKINDKTVAEILDSHLNAEEHMASRPQ